MISDSIYFQGKHFSNPELPCQDYALDAEKEDGYGIIAISDGCSSAKNTDLSARILLHLAITELKNNHPIGPHLIFPAYQILSSLGFTKKDIFEALCTTLLTAAEKENEIEIYCAGGGIICAQYEGYFHVINLEYLDNAPYYLAYEAFTELKEEYQKSYPKNKKFVSTLKFRVLDYEKFIYLNSFSYNHLEILEFNNMEVPYDSSFSTFFLKDRLQKLLLISDGIKSFEYCTSGKRDGVKWEGHAEIIWERILVQISDSWDKNSYGALSRKMVSLKKKWEELGWVMRDDLAVGVLMRRK